MDFARPQDLIDAHEIQSALEAFAARLTARRGVSSAQSALLIRYVVSMEETAATFGALSADLLGRYVDMSRRFHRLMFELAECPVLQRHLDEGWIGPYSVFVTRSLTRDRIDALRKFIVFEQDQHRSLIEAIVQRNSARADALAQEHARFNQRFLKALWNESMWSMVWPHARIPAKPAATE